MQVENQIKSNKRCKSESNRSSNITSRIREITTMLRAYRVRFAIFWRHRDAYLWERISLLLPRTLRDVAVERVVVDVERNEAANVVHSLRYASR